LGIGTNIDTKERLVDNKGTLFWDRGGHPEACHKKVCANGKKGDRKKEKSPLWDGGGDEGGGKHRQKKSGQKEL